jgi:hypothetical protein
VDAMGSSNVRAQAVEGKRRTTGENPNNSSHNYNIQRNRERIGKIRIERSWPKRTDACVGRPIGGLKICMVRKGRSGSHG